MEHQEPHLTVGEYTRRMESVEKQIANGFARMDTRFDRVDERMTGHGERIRVLETRDRAESRATTKRVAGWTTAISVMVAGILKGLQWVFGG